MATLLASNVTGNLSVTGIVSCNASPLVNTATRVYTGLAAFMTANTSRTSNVTMNAENNLAITLNETGVYSLTGVFLINAKSNGASGIQIDFGGGTATVNNISWGASGAINGVSNVSIRITANNTALSYATITSNTTDWIELTGFVQVNTTGTLIPRYAQVVSSANSANISANSFWELTKIG